MAGAPSAPDLCACGFGRTPRTGGEVEIVLDGDALAANHKYFKFGGARHSPDHRLEAWSADIKGSEYFSIRVRDWADGVDRDDLVEETDGGGGFGTETAETHGCAFCFWFGVRRFIAAFVLFFLSTPK